MPFYSPSAEDLRDAYKLRGDIGTSEFQQLWGLENHHSARLTFVCAWARIMTIGFSFMHSNFGQEKITADDLDGPFSAAQEQTWHHLLLDADLMIEADDGVSKGGDWESFIAGRRLAYHGEVVAKAERLTFDQVEPALPPGQLAGSIDILVLLPPHVQQLYLPSPSSVSSREKTGPTLSRRRK